MQILVLGMHRSGTSAVSRLLNMMGVYFGPEGISIASNDENPKGFWERHDLRRLNDILIRSVGCEWNSVSRFRIADIPADVLESFQRDARKIIMGMDARRPWFLKDPRLCLLTPLWLELMDVPLLVHVHRNPLEVAKSLEKRGYSLEFGLALWEKYICEILNASVGKRFVHVNYSDLMADPVQSTRQLQRDLETVGVRNLREPSQREIEAFIDPNLYRSRPSTHELNLLSPAQLRLVKAFNGSQAPKRSTPWELSESSQAILKRAEEERERAKTIALLLAENEQREKRVSSLQSEVEGVQNAVTRLQTRLDILADEASEREKEMQLVELKRRAIEKKNAGINSVRLKELAALREMLTAKLSRSVKPVPVSQHHTAWLEEFTRLSEAAHQTLLPALAVPIAPGKFYFAEWKTAQSRSILAAPWAEPVSIVIPIYNGTAELERCVNSIFRETTIPYEILLIDDCSPDETTQHLLRQLAKHECVRVIKNESNLGFVRTANAGLRASSNDVLLLNSDTEVSHRWLQKLKLAAYSDTSVGTVTPFSNASGAFSVPDIGVNSPLPYPFDLEKMGRLIERTSTREHQRVPTGNGFCMYIKRAVLDEVGAFDEENFGRGYGEENDFCMRAGNCGWVHLLDDTTFVYHQGSASFGAEKQLLIKANRAILDRKHPDYTRLVREFVDSPVLEKVRDRIRAALIKGEPELHLHRPRILYVLQKGAGGVPMTNADLTREISTDHECFLLTSSGTEMTLAIYHRTRTVEIKRWKWNERWSATEMHSEEAQHIYLQVLTACFIDLVHIRHLFKHTFDLPPLCKKLGIPVVLSFHDYYFVCPSIHLLDQNQRYCGGVCTPGLAQCTLPSPMLEDMPMLKLFLPEWRAEVSATLQCCDAFVTTAESVREVHQTAFPEILDRPFWVIEHGRDFAAQESGISAPEVGKPIKMLVPGSIDPHKGALLIARIAELDTEGAIEFHFLGKTSEEVARIGQHHGRYDRDNFAALVREIGPSCAGIFSTWPETYCHTLTEAWSVGLPVFGSALGAVGERIERHKGGWLINPESAEETYASILQAMNDHEKYARIVENVSNIRSDSVEEMAQQYRTLYRWSLSKKRVESHRYQTKIGSFVPPGGRGSTFIRVTLPLQHPDLRNDISYFPLPRHLSKNRIAEVCHDLNMDTLLVQRDALNIDQAKALVDQCQLENSRIAFEIDDDLFSVDEDHPNQETYQLAVEAMRFVAETANQVIVSTPKLGRALERINSTVRIVPNAVDDWTWFRPLPKPKRNRSSRTVVVGYMGTVTHEADLEMIKPAFLAAQEILLKKHLIHLELELIGGMKADENQEWFKRLKVPPHTSRYPDFVGWMRQNTNWDFALAPLVSNRLNAAKSGLKFLEYGAMEVPGIFSKVGEYPEMIQHEFDGLLIPDSDLKQWEESIIRLASDPEFRAILAKNARQTIITKHLLSNNMHHVREAFTLKN